MIELPNLAETPTSRYAISNQKAVRIGLLTALACFVLDQLHKWYMIYVIEMPARPPIRVTPFFDLVMVWNRGVSFGMFTAGNMLQMIGLILLALAIVAMLLNWLSRSDSLLLSLGIGLIVGGAIGNVIDRARFGAVADFFSFHLAGYYWPAFNIADSGICVGVALLFLDSMLGPQKKKDIREGQ